jgi:hypothetical protein
LFLHYYIKDRILLEEQLRAQPPQKDGLLDGKKFLYSSGEGTTKLP